jgi:hypothetical protein
MKKLLTTSLSTLATIATGLYLFPANARACDFGCALVQGLGWGFGTSAAAGITSAIVNHHNSSSRGRTGTRLRFFFSRGILPGRSRRHQWHEI